MLLGPQGGLSIGLVLITLTVATEALIVTAIMPVIVKDIGGLQFYGLAFSAFFLAGLAAIPVAGWAADRYGPALPFVVLIGVFIAGSLLAALAPSMPVLILGRALQGYGANAQFTLSQATITRAYTGGARVRVLSLMSLTWAVPSLVGPSLGAFVTQATSWRWALGIVVVPAVLASVITFPRLRPLGPGSAGPYGPPPVRVPLQVAAGAGLVIGGLTSGAWWGLVAVPLGLVALLLALRETLPAGSLTLRRGLPAIVGASFFLNLAFYGSAPFVPLLLTQLRGVDITAAGVAVTAAMLSWVAAVMLNTKLVHRVDNRVLLVASTLLLALGIGLFGTAALGVPLPVAYVGWMFAGGGMGLAFNTLTLNAMHLAPAGRAGGAMGARNLTTNLGTAMGSGIGGAIIAAVTTLGLGLQPALLAIYGLAVASALTTMAISPRSATSL